MLRFIYLKKASLLKDYFMAGVLLNPNFCNTSIAQTTAFQIRRQIYIPFPAGGTADILPEFWRKNLPSLGEWEK
jgi:hypothetical protein